MKLLLKPLLSQYDDSRGGKTTEFHMNEYLPFALHTGVGFSDPYRSKATPFPGEACEINQSFTSKNGKLLGEKLAKQLCRTAHSPHASFNLVPVCLGTLRGGPLNNGSNWRRQASIE